MERAVLFICCVTALAACGGSVVGTLPTTGGQTTAAWMSGDETTGDLLYVADQNKNQVDVYSMSDHKLVGKLTGFDGLAFMCVDGAGDIFIPNYGQHEVLEYAHGGTTPIATLQDSVASPYSCSVDPETGNLAVANYSTASGAGSIAVYTHAQGQPQIYQGPGANLFCAYDDKGNLFIEAFTTGSQGNQFKFSELRKGAKIFNNVALESIPAYPNGLQWTGSYMAIGTGSKKGPSSGDTYIYHVQLAQGVGKTIGSTHLVERAGTTNFFISRDRIAVTGGSPSTDTRLFAYPAGGTTTMTLTQSGPTGVVVSPASKGVMSAAGPHYETLFEFNGTNGANPAAKLVELNGKLYGTTMSGGTYSDGTVFSITPGGKETVVHSFGAANDGKEPESGLAVLGGVLYGTTYYGGLYDFGTVFAVTPDGKERVLHHFGKEPDGQHPTAGMTPLKGMLFGTTSSGGDGSGGTIFSITTGGKERVIHRFPYYETTKVGDVPFAGLVASKGLLYGATMGGGKCNGGTVFDVTIAGKVKALYNLNCGVNSGYDAEADLLMIGHELFGTTFQGGKPFYNSGTVFSVNLSTHKGRELTYFPSSSDGAWPHASLIAVQDLLYGTTSRGGDNDAGVIFSLTKSGHETVIHSFGLPPDGQKPLAGLVNVNGTLYGTTSTGGGFNNDGTVYKVTVGP